ncbi:MAG: hypothetical protein ACK5V5_14970 [Cyclobacteriaceae bacterium]
MDLLMCKAGVEMTFTILTNVGQNNLGQIALKMGVMRKLMNGFLFVALLSFKTNGQQMRSNWQEQLKPCEVEIPLHYATKNQSKLIEAAEKYRGVELILVTIDKKNGPSYKSYYLERFQGDFGPSAYLVKSEYIDQDRRPEHVIFLRYNPKDHTFYKADCFRDNSASQALKHNENHN